jgi:hypothetical protein
MEKPAPDIRRFPCEKSILPRPGFDYSPKRDDQPAQNVTAIVRIWILLSVLLAGSGWILSALHQLNRTGYAVVFALAAMICGWRLRKCGCPSRESVRRSWHKLLRRFRRPAPLLFLTLALMTLVAGGLYVCQNNDSNEYRIPRVWHWLAEGQWHWIHTLDDRMNIAGCGFEWLSAPLMLFTRSDRLFFLANWISYLMLPGLIFSVFRRLQVRPRVAWWWMWLLASGWCYAMQASSTVNDSFAVIYALAAVDLALRSAENNRVEDWWLSMLAAALLTGAKQTDIPLAGLWLVAAWPGARLLRTRPLGTAAVIAVSLLVSALPLSLFNFQHAGNWMGIPQNAGVHFSSLAGAHLSPSSPFWGIIGNAICIPLQNLQPPYFPWVEAWNAAKEHFFHTTIGGHFSSFEDFAYLAQGASETNAGIGLGMTVLTLISVGAAHRCARVMGVVPRVKSDRQLLLLRTVPWALLLLFMAKVATMEPARQIAAYYVFLFPLFLARPGHACLARQGWWQKLGLLVMLLTAGVLVVSRSQPLFPAETLLVPLKEKYPGWKFLSKAWDSYACRLSVETQRRGFNDGLLRGESVVGYATVRGSQEAGLWLPFGRRRVVRVLPGDTPRQLQSAGVHYVVLDSSGLQMSGTTIEQWVKQYRGVLVDRLDVESQPGKTGSIYLVSLSLKPPAS